MELLKKHVDTVVILGGILGAVLWMNGKFTDIDSRFADVNERFSQVEKEIAIIKTVLLMKDVMPKELAQKDKVDLKEDARL